MPTSEPQVFPYARCQNCGDEFADRAAMEAHMEATHAASPDGISHTIATVNPTPAERARNRVLSEFDDAIMKLTEDLDEAIERGDFTVADVRAAAHDFPDFADAWAECEAGR